MLARREGLTAPDRNQFVGLRPANKSERIRAGAHILTRGSKPSLANDQGYVTSVAFSPMLGYWIGLGLLKGGRARHGETVQVWDGLRQFHMLAEVCDPMFYDKEHVKLHG
jgi:sarcosine oxidase subunit alpha